MFQFANKLLAKHLRSFIILLLLGFSPLAVSGIHQTNSETIDYDIPLLAIGPISNIDAENGSILVNGQLFITDSQTKISNQTAVGDYVAVGGEIMHPGVSLATEVITLDDAYTAGASPAYIRAIIENNDPSLALATSGISKLDYSAALHADVLISQNEEVEFIGHAFGNSFFASAVTILGTASAGGQSDLQNIRGSGLRNIRGSGLRNIRGSGLRNIRGSGLRNIRGSGLRNIRGSGLRNIRGSGLRNIRGSGLRNIRGSGLRNIRGSGLRSTGNSSTR
jgi:hypothetical protein